MDDIGNKRPSCQICNKKESAQMLINGKFMCANCIMKYQEYQNNKAKKDIEDFKDAIYESKNR